MTEGLKITTDPEGSEEARLGVRALAAYYRSAGTEQIEQPDQPEYVRYEGLRYVALHRGGKVLAVFRVQNTGQLRRMRRPPKPLLAHYKQRQDQQQEGQADE